jgi:hypothetical protein
MLAHRPVEPFFHHFASPVEQPLHGLVGVEVFGNLGDALADRLQRSAIKFDTGVAAPRASSSAKPIEDQRPSSQSALLGL